MGKDMGRASLSFCTVSREAQGLSTQNPGLSPYPVAAAGSLKGRHGYTPPMARLRIKTTTCPTVTMESLPGLGRPCLTEVRIPRAPCPSLSVYCQLSPLQGRAWAICGPLLSVVVMSLAIRVCVLRIAGAQVAPTLNKTASSCLFQESVCILQTYPLSLSNL